MSLLRPKLIISLLAAVALLWPSRAESPVAASSLPASRIVKIEHELIRVPRTASLVRLSPRRTTDVHRTASARPQQLKEQGLAARAGRMLVGDGRYRPEPFPRPAR